VRRFMDVKISIKREQKAESIKQKAIEADDKSD
jgi:hypothetical protein